MEKEQNMKVFLLFLPPVFSSKLSFPCFSDIEDLPPAVQEKLFDEVLDRDVQKGDSPRCYSNRDHLIWGWGNQIQGDTNNAEAQQWEPLHKLHYIKTAANLWPYSVTCFSPFACILL